MKVEDVATTILNLDVVFRAKMIIQRVENAGHIVPLNVPKEAFVKSYLKALFVIVIVDDI